MNLLQGYGTYLTGLGMILGGASTILTALAQGGEIPNEALLAVGNGFGLVFLRRAIPPTTGGK